MKKEEKKQPEPITEESLKENLLEMLRVTAESNPGLLVQMLREAGWTIICTKQVPMNL